jgi:D-tyrosyl-tRNA(Tyr) deacylase
MKLVVQRVKSAEVRLPEDGGRVVGRIGFGMLVLLCVLAGDTEADAEALAEKLARFRFFADGEGRMNLAAGDVGAGVLVVSQFTLAADGRKGRRPSFDAAAAPDVARLLYAHFADHLVALGLSVERGAFGELMEVELVGDGPVTFVLEEPRPGVRQSSQVLT